jgi:predicted permease
MLNELFHRFTYLFRRSCLDADLETEFQFHVEMRAAELEAEGLTPAAAVAQARREFGPSARICEDSRAAWQFRWLEDLAGDLCYAARTFRRNPSFSLTAIACLALGIGANITIFSISNEVLFSRPSVRDPQSLLYVRVGGSSHVPMNVYRFLRNASIFDGLAGENEEIEVNWREGAQSSRLYAISVTDNFFAVTGMSVALGRPIQTGERDTTVLTYGLWQRQFDGDPAAVGRKMILDGRLYRIAGILARDHRTMPGFGYSPDLYVPVLGDDSVVALYARIPPGMNRAIAYARLESACSALDGPHPPDRHRWARDISLSAISGIDHLRSDSQFVPIAAFFGMLMVVVGLVLIIACANVASLLLARASSRGHELAIRLSIGAGRGRLIRQLLAESLLLAICGTIAGLVLNIVLTKGISRIRLILPIPIQYQIEPDWRLLAYATALAVLSCLAAGWMPALKATRAGLSDALKREERQVAGSWNLRNALVIGQLAVSIVLLCAGLLFVRNLVRASTTSPGFDLQHTVWAAMRRVPEAHTDPQKDGAFAALAIEHLRALAGVDSVALARVVPLNDNMTKGVSVRTDLSPEPVHITFRYNNVSPGYFHVMQIPILRGREFLDSDRGGTQRVAIINDAMARRLFGRSDPIGHTIKWDSGELQIVGIAKNSKYFTLGEQDMPAYYEPYAQMSRLPGGNLHFLIRAARKPESLVAPIDAALGHLDATAAVETKPMSQALLFALLPSRFGAAILGSVGLLGLALAAIGLYGVLLYSVSRRFREIGLRIALGATPHAVLSLVLRQSATLAATGIVIGLGLAVFTMKPLAMFLTPEIRTGDPINFAVVAAVLFTVALMATVEPTLRALRIDPITALRHD